MKKWLFFTMVLLFTFLIWQGYVFIQNLLEPQNLQAVEAEKIIEQAYNVKEIHNIEHYAGLSKEYQVAEVTTESNKRVYIWVSLKDNETYIMNVNDGLKKEEILSKLKAKEEPKEVIRITPGLEGSKKNRLPVWEVVFIDKKDRYTFYYVNFKTGEYLQSYRLNKES
jgi:uncharacterized protein YpmB